MFCLGEVLGRSADQDPAFQLEVLTGPDFDYRQFGLLTHDAPALSVDGYCFVSVKQRTLDQETGVLTIVCRDDGRHRHLLAYTLDIDSLVSHEMLEDEPDPRNMSV